MNMLIIGNGFDLAHGRPTTYSDFLQFLDYILLSRDYQGDRTQFESVLDIKSHPVKEYILSTYDTRKNPGTEAAWNKNTTIQELYECLDKNVWYEYFQLLHKENELHGKNWIDFEGEIREVIEFFDREIKDIYEDLPKSLISPQDVPVKIACFCKRLDFTEYNQTNSKNGYKKIHILISLRKHTRIYKN